MKQRLATGLPMLADKFGVATPQPESWPNLPQETLANLIGSTRQRINQAFNDRKTRNLLRHQYRRMLFCGPGQSLEAAGLIGIRNQAVQDHAIAQTSRATFADLRIGNLLRLADCLCRL